MPIRCIIAEHPSIRFRICPRQGDERKKIKGKKERKPFLRSLPRLPSPERTDTRHLLVLIFIGAHMGHF